MQLILVVRVKSIYISKDNIVRVDQFRLDFLDYFERQRYF